MPVINGYQPGDEKEILILFKRIFGQERSAEYWRWENLENPHGESVLTLLRDESGIRGHLCLHASLLKVGEDYIAAGQRINSMLDKEYRRQGHFGKMFEHLWRRGKKQGMAFIYGFPNLPSLRALSKTGRVRVLGEVPRYVKFFDGLKAAQHLAGNRLPASWTEFLLQGFLGIRRLFWALKGRFQPPSPGPGPNPGEAASLKVAVPGAEEAETGGGVHLLERFDARFDKLWYEASKSLGVTTVRDSAYLNWRYGSSPQDYKIWAYEEEDGSISGYLVLLQEEGVGHIIDLLALEGKEKALPALLSQAEKEVEGACHALSCWCLDRGAVSGVLQKHGFLRIRSQNRLVLSNLDCLAELEEILLEAKNWYITMGDSDYK